MKYKRLLVLVCIFSLTLSACGTGVFAPPPTPTPTPRPTPTPTPDPLARIFADLQSEGISASRAEDGMWGLKIGKVDVPNAYFDEKGEALHIQMEEKGYYQRTIQVDIPAAEAPERLKINAFGALLLRDKEQRTIAFFEPAKADRSWFVLTQENLLVDSFEKLEAIDGEFLLGPEMLPFLRKLDAEGMIEHPGPHAMPIKPGWLTNDLKYDREDLFYDKYGFKPLFSFENARENRSDLLMRDPDKRDWTVARIYRTNLFGIDFVALVFRYNNGGEEPGFEIRLKLRALSESRSSTLDLGRASGIGSSSMYRIPKSYLINPQRCKEILRQSHVEGNPRDFCSWYATHLEVTQPMQIFDDFITTGKFVNRNEILPITIAGSQYVGK